MPALRQFRLGLLESKSLDLSLLRIRRWKIVSPVFVPKAVCYRAQFIPVERPRDLRMQFWPVHQSETARGIRWWRCVQRKTFYWIWFVRLGPEEFDDLGASPSVGNAGKQDVFFRWLNVAVGGINARFGVNELPIDNSWIFILLPSSVVPSNARALRALVGSEKTIEAHTV